MAYVGIDDAELWVEDSGGSGTPLVLLHGAAGHSGCWVSQTPAFTAAGYRVIAFDLRGFGRTRPAPGREAAGSIAGDLEALSDALSLPPFFLVATAYGGFGAIEFALDDPGRVRALVVSTSFGGLSDPEFAAIRAQHVRPDLEKLSTIEKELGATFRANNPEGVRRFEAMEHGSYKGAGARQTLRRPTTLGRLEGMSVPTLVIAADEDLYAPPPVMRAFASHIPGCKFEVIKDAGHCAYWEKPEEWNRLVLNFLAEQADHE